MGQGWVRAQQGRGQPVRRCSEMTSTSLYGTGGHSKNYYRGKESNNLRFSDLEDIQFSAPKGSFSKPRSYIYQVGSR